MIEIRGVDHIGIRVADVARSVAFYRKLGFAPVYEAEDGHIVIVENAAGVSINFLTNTTDDLEGKNVLMDVDAKYPGYTHVALAIESMPAAVAALETAGIAVSSGPMKLGRTSHSLFIRDPDRNVIELTARG